MKEWGKKMCLAEVADFCLGKMLDQRKNRGEPLPYLANLNVRWGEFNLNDLREMRFESHEKARYGLKHGDIVMCEGGEPGRCAIWKDNQPDMMFQKALHRIRPHDGVDNFFLFYSFLHMGRTGQFAPLFTGATIKHLPREKLAKIEIAIPPPQVQKQIAKVLSAYDDLIENNRRRIQLLEQAAQLLYQEWFVRLRFPGHEHAKIKDGIPEGWADTCLPEIIDVNPQTTCEKGKEIWYVPMSALSESGMTVDLSQLERRTGHTSVKFKKDDVLLARITPCLENGKTGLSYFLAEDEVACGSTEFIVLRGKKVSPAYTYCLARSYSLRGVAIKSMIGASGRQRVQASCFCDYKAPRPPQHILDMFDEIAGKQFNQIKILMAQQDLLVRARDLLLPRLMSGKVAV